jgi:hypothetical protein
MRVPQNPHTAHSRSGALLPSYLPKLIKTFEGLEHDSDPIAQLH